MYKYSFPLISMHKSENYASNAIFFLLIAIRCVLVFFRVCVCVCMLCVFSFSFVFLFGINWQSCWVFFLSFFFFQFLKLYLVSRMFSLCICFVCVCVACMFVFSFSFFWKLVSSLAKYIYLGRMLGKKDKLAEHRGMTHLALFFFFFKIHLLRFCICILYDSWSEIHVEDTNSRQLNFSSMNTVVPSLANKIRNNNIFLFLAILQLFLWFSQLSWNFAFVVTFLEFQRLFLQLPWFFLEFPWLFLEL